MGHAEDVMSILNLFAPRESSYKFRCIIIKHILLFDILSIVPLHWAIATGPHLW